MNKLKFVQHKTHEIHRYYQRKAVPTMFICGVSFETRSVFNVFKKNFLC